MPPSSYLPHELIVSEILLRLPANSLLQLKCVCKAWRDTISDDASFSEAHVRRHLPHAGRPSSLLIAPYITNIDDLKDQYSTPGLYLWKENQRQQDDVATLMHDMAWFPAQDYWRETRHGFAYCDGLVMLPDDAEGAVRVVNPATRRSLTLPRSAASSQRSGCLEVKNAFGFGRHPSSGIYTVVRFFHYDTLALPVVTYTFGVEVFTIKKDSCWRQTKVGPMYPFLAGRTATFFKGSLIWTVDIATLINHAMPSDAAAGMPCFVHFSLEDESFSIMAEPRWYTTRKKLFSCAPLFTISGALLVHHYYHATAKF
ncbi:hypothetical protein QYE76_036377 [Lolium multiflorum]|uniref:F-box domain-containing protein n=1 Tax=Lolium multiflorum TaxID=4521 RepID=A0AAD8R4A2_LOLMU|nr:hypothetical protein QYE76_036377 [Lolium multiflorum]